jgi:hypothetical protein
VPAYHLDPAVVLGDYKGQLDNDGERLLLVDAKGSSVDDVATRRTPWPVGADALGAGGRLPAGDSAALDRHRFMGRSLERLSLDLPGASAANWTPRRWTGPRPGGATAPAGGRARW